MKLVEVGFDTLFATTATTAKSFAIGNTRPNNRIDVSYDYFSTAFIFARCYNHLNSVVAFQLNHLLNINPHPCMEFLILLIGGDGAQVYSR